MNWKSAYTEFGKQLLNIAVAGLVFAFIQPFVHKELSIRMALWAIGWYAIFSEVGALLIAYRGRDGK